MKSLEIKNTFNVKKVHYISPECQNYCPLGEDYCTYKVVVDLVPASLIFDYDALTEYISTFNNGERTREQFGWEIYNYLLCRLTPKSLSVTVFNTADNSYITF